MADLENLPMQAAERTGTSEIEIAKLHHDDVEVERVQARMKELEEISRRFEQKDEKAKKLAEMNRKNRAENFKNASEMKPVNTNLKAGEAGHDPFSRRWTRSTNYYVSRAAANGGENGDAAAGPGDGDSVGPTNGVEAGEAATATALKAAAGAGKLVDTKAQVDQGTESISQVVKLGFLARKQWIEATIGYKVPDNDGR